MADPASRALWASIRRALYLIIRAIDVYLGGPADDKESDPAPAATRRH